MDENEYEPEIRPTRPTYTEDRPCVRCGVLMEHTVDIGNRWASPAPHTRGDRVCHGLHRVPVTR